MDKEIENVIQERMEASQSLEAKREHEAVLLLKCFATGKRLPEGSVDTVSVERAFNLIKSILCLKD